MPAETGPGSAPGALAAAGLVALEERVEADTAGSPVRSIRFPCYLHILHGLLGGFALERPWSTLFGSLSMQKCGLCDAAEVTVVRCHCLVQESGAGKGQAELSTTGSEGTDAPLERIALQSACNGHIWKLDTYGPLQ